MRASLVVCLFLISVNYVSRVEATVWGYQAKLSNLAGLEIKIADDAIGACWTNLKEVREYTEEKLRMKGARLVSFADLSNKQYSFSVWVNGGRVYNDGTGPCWGLVQISLKTFTVIDGVTHAAVLGELTNSFIHPKNLNYFALEMIREFIGKLN